MFLLNWYEKYLIVKMQSRRMSLEIQQEKDEDEHRCESCETLKQQLAIANSNNEKLMERLLEKPEVEKVEAPSAELKPIQTSRFVPHAVRRQMQNAEEEHELRLIAERKRLKDEYEARYQERIKEESEKGGLAGPTKVTTETTKLEQELGVNNA